MQDGYEDSAISANHEGCLKILNIGYQILRYALTYGRSEHTVDGQTF